MFYLVRTPVWLRWYYPGCIWTMPAEGKKLYLTFDDGPHPEITPRVLDCLRKFGAAASFFCVGENVMRYREMYEMIIEQGHSVGNHTFHHLKGTEVGVSEYREDVDRAAGQINSRLFRPPYGKFRRGQLKDLSGAGYRTILWDVLSGDFDKRNTAADCSRNVIRNAGPGSIVVFHDSEKAWPRLQSALPEVLEHFLKKGFSFERIP